MTDTVTARAVLVPVKSFRAAKHRLAGVLDAEAREALAKQLASGVIAAAFAMDSRRSPFRPDTAAIFDLVATKMRANTVTVLGAAREQGISSHFAALALAQERVGAAMAARAQPVPGPAF